MRVTYAKAAGQQQGTSTSRWEERSLSADSLSPHQSSQAVQILALSSDPLEPYWRSHLPVAPVAIQTSSGRAPVPVMSTPHRARADPRARGTAEHATVAATSPNILLPQHPEVLRLQQSDAPWPYSSDVDSAAAVYGDSHVLPHAGEPAVARATEAPQEEVSVETSNALAATAASVLYTRGTDMPLQHVRSPFSPRK